ncbi:MAG: diaminopimelate epimerase [Gammaproteobacteria bacterium CG_4_10_14_0_8_um_filter_38_16]|nr:MAG: diaminopimelate epimerase [Gammaproteobacteria bacterium CG_4_10_14_0_8_um_filter_38_16]PJA03158.1 MAG: diaminopimelate epimerase [Gammaproteobacteria bacterium CG_4_10_14_0_2_um_filter_38_22]PJB10541.1 MAG: diaminopimelate epimerase [Gammaproteobacteria bacterium CG_4_9_14_3_um_filter_38_9]
MSFLFTKMHALGNDFIVIDAVSQPVQMTKTLACALSDRHRGVGCDQILLLTSPQNIAADFGYQIFNPDGTEVFQCGNGARCMGLFVQQKKLSDKKTITLETKRGLIRVACMRGDEVQVDIAKPDFHPASLPFITSEISAPFHITVLNEVLECGVVSIGNPHCVLKQDYTESEMIAVGKALNASALFPEGINVGFVKIVSRNIIHLRVYERGAGMTQACGSGACAAMAIGRQSGQLDATVRVHQLGGVLTVNWQSPDDWIQLCGSATTVFEGSCSFS